MLTIRWDINARNDFLDQINYIAEHDQAAADDLYSDVEYSVSNAAANPNLYVAWILPNTHFLVIRDNYVIVYEVTDSECIVRVFDHARQGNH